MTVLDKQNVKQRTKLNAIQFPEMKLPIRKTGEATINENAVKFASPQLLTIAVVR
jgi:hypothetical protein